MLCLFCIISAVDQKTQPLDGIALERGPSSRYSTACYRYRGSMIGSSTTNVTHTLRSRPKIFTVFMSDCMGHAGTCRCLLRETYDNWLHLLPPKHCCATLLTGRICRSYSGLESSLSWHNSIDVTCNCTSTVYTPTCMHIGHDFQLITQHLQHCQFKIHTQSYACKDNSDMFVSDCMQCAAYVRGQHSSSRWSFTSRLTWEPNRTPLQGGPLHAHLISQTPETCDNNPSTPLELSHAAGR